MIYYKESKIDNSDIWRNMKKKEKKDYQEPQLTQHENLNEATKGDVRNSGIES